MAFGSFSSGKNQPMAEINMIPMIDVMLVLLIIFIVTAPLLTHAVKIELPRASSSADANPAKQVQVAIKADQQVYWDGELVDDAGLSAKLDEVSRLESKPEIHLHVDKNAIYEKVAKLLSSAANRGLTKIAFVTDPSPAH